MKLLKINNFVIYSLFIIGYGFNSCSDENPVTVDETQNAASIKEYIAKLNYDPTELLNYQETGGQEATREVIEDTSETMQEGNKSITCSITKYSLKKNFDQVAILRPTTGIVWAGALVKGNQSLMDGVPEPIGVGRAPITISVNLPGMGQNGIKTVESPAASNVQAAVDEALEWWNANAYIDGYVNAANSSFNLSTSFSSTQLALDVDLNAEWATGSVSSHFNYQSSETKKTVMAVFKQSFFDVIFDTPTSPEQVFSSSESLEKVQTVVDADAAPAYIKSVSYGRIIMFRMETTGSYSSTEVEGAFKYAAGYTVDGSLETKYRSILEESSIDLVTIGGNAAVATEPISQTNSSSADNILNKIHQVITGENAVYSRNNPGVPIAYSVFYLKDNSLAKLGYSTEYTAKECVATQTYNDFSISLQNFTAIKDCDGIEGKGDFDFSVQIFDEADRSLTSKYSSGGFDLSNNESLAINKTLYFSLDRRAGKKFKVKFICNEWDKPIIGNAYKDSRMNGKTGTNTHEFTASGTWSDISGIRTITLNSGTDCSTSLSYRVSVN